MSDPRKPEEHPGQGQGPATTPPGHGGTPPGQQPKPNQDLPEGPEPDQDLPEEPKPAPKK